MSSHLHELLYSPFPELLNKKTISELLGDIAEMWHSMSKEKQKLAVVEGIQTLMDERESHSLSQQNMQLECFHDARTTLARIATEVTVTLFIQSGTNLLDRYITFMHERAQR